MQEGKVGQKELELRYKTRLEHLKPTEDMSNKIYAFGGLGFGLDTLGVLAFCLLFNI